MRVLVSLTLGTYLVGVGAGCATRGRQEDPRAQAPPASAPEPSITLAGEGALPEPEGSQMAWQLAERGDPMDLAALAQGLGAAELAVLLEAGGRRGSVALQAFEHARDAYAERERLCALVPRLSGRGRQQGLGVLERVLQGVPEREGADPEVDARCRERVAALGAGELDAEERDLASVILRRLEPRARRVP